ncbi:MAG TPA: hypothetical protein VEG37_01025 [Burkholderiales bacterium]|nr:hypothetical protein [Burkholderiales bacterium]
MIKRILRRWRFGMQAAKQAVAMGLLIPQGVVATKACAQIAPSLSGCGQKPRLGCFEAGLMWRIKLRLAPCIHRFLAATHARFILLGTPYADV